MLAVDERAYHVFALVNIGKHFAENYDEAKMLYRTVILRVVQHVKVNQSRQYLCEDDGRLRE